MQSTKNHAQNKAREFVTNGIRNNHFSPGNKLPTVKALSKLAGVSTDTMRKALTQLKLDGVLESVRGHYLFVKSDLPAFGSNITFSQPAVSSSCGSLWLRTKNHLLRDIVNGMYLPGRPLPGISEFMHTYRVSFRTMKKALCALEQEDVIRSYKRGYELPSLPFNTSPARIVLIGHRHAKDKINLGMHDEAFLRHLEMACARANVQVDICTVDDNFDGINGTDFTSGKTTPLLQGDQVFGYLYLANMDTPVHARVLKMLPLTRKPVAVLDETGNAIDDASLLKSRRLKIFRMTVSQAPARQIAHYLLSLGHKHIAFISPFHDAVWSQQRLKGLREVYAMAGSGVAVSAYISHKPFKESALEHSGIQVLQRAFHAWRRTAQVEFIKEVEPLFATIEEKGIRWGELRRQLKEHFSKALSDRSITAWVFPTDFLGDVAMDFLADRGIKIPEAISLIGFDDSFRSLRCGLASYNFNIEAVANAMLQYVIHGKVPGVPNDRKCIEIKGAIVNRRSIARAHYRRGNG
ncbi:MAG: GntR family transcriptional regulator [Chitinivibrionales bacterium]|nr:GntR family transcriptional regulator [Chitinivibrionales bacterium]